MNPLADRDTFESETFDGLDLSGADLGGRALDGCVFRHCKLPETRWHRSRLESCRFEGCDLTRANVTMLAARGVVFAGCKLLGIDWSPLGTSPDLAFEDCSLRYAAFVKLKLRKLAVTRCAVTDASFVDVDLAQAVFTACDLGGHAVRPLRAARGELPGREAARDRSDQEPREGPAHSPRRRDPPRGARSGST